MAEQAEVAPGDRARQLAVLRAVLGGYGMQVGMGPGRSVALTSAMGAKALASSPDDVWAVAERLIGAAIDPLDPRILALG